MSVEAKDIPSNSNGSIPAITGALDHRDALHIFPDFMKPYRSTIIAYGASFLGTTIGFPMDTVKTRMQTHREFTSYFDCAAKTFKAEGMKGFFRGIWAPLISTSCSKSINVSLFSYCKPFCHDLIYQHDDDNTTHPIIRNIPVCFSSGMIAGAGVSLFASPFEFTKVFSQISKLVERDSVHKVNLSSASTLATFKKIIKYEGPTGLYSGFRYHVMRDSLSSGIYYSIYETFKYSINQLINSDPSTNSPVAILLAGGFSGITCWTLVFPIDTTKSLIQKDIIHNIFRKRDGLEPHPLPERKIRIERSLYRGLGISVTRSFIVNMVFFSAFEFLMGHIA